MILAFIMGLTDLYILTGYLTEFFKHWLPPLSKPYYLIKFVDPFLHYINVVTGQFV